MAITHAEVCRRLEQQIEMTGSIRKAARVLGISSQYLSFVLRGERQIGPKLLRRLRLRRRIIKVITYEERPRR